MGVNVSKGWLTSIRGMLSYLHDAIEHRQGHRRFTPEGREVQPFDVAYAAQITGRNAKYIANAINPNEAQEMTLRDFHLLLLAGMDCAPLDEIERSLGRVAITVPQVHDHEDIQSELMACIKEFGDIGAVLQKVTSADSAVGKKISRRKELPQVKREIDEAVAKIYELYAAIEEQSE